MKRISIILFTVIITIRGYAQSQFVIFAGPHLSTAKYTIKNVKQETDYKFGFHVGAGWKIQFENNLYFSPDIGYSLMGYKVKFKNPSFPPDVLATDNNTTFHQLDVNVLLQYDLTSNPNHFTIKAGPALNFVLSGNEEFNLATGQHIEQKMKYGTHKEYGSYLASGVVQFGYEQKNNFGIYLHYVRGFGSMNNSPGGPGIYNRFIGITVGKFFKSKSVR